MATRGLKPIMKKVKMVVEKRLQKLTYRFYCVHFYLTADIFNIFDFLLQSEKIILREMTKI